MSEGPIKAERDAWLPKRVTTNPTTSIHFANTLTTLACGRKPETGKRTTNRDDVTCSDCSAALRADDEAR